MALARQHTPMTTRISGLQATGFQRQITYGYDQLGRHRPHSERGGGVGVICMIQWDASQVKWMV